LAVTRARAAVLLTGDRAHSTRTAPAATLQGSHADLAEGEARLACSAIAIARAAVRELCATRSCRHATTRLAAGRTGAAAAVALYRAASSRGRAVQRARACRVARARLRESGQSLTPAWTFTLGIPCSQQIPIEPAGSRRLGNRSRSRRHASEEAFETRFARLVGKTEQARLFPAIEAVLAGSEGSRPLQAVFGTAAPT
jgi:hypothetical protein